MARTLKRLIDPTRPIFARWVSHASGEPQECMAAAYGLVRVVRGREFGSVHLLPPLEESGLSLSLEVHDGGIIHVVALAVDYDDEDERWIAEATLAPGSDTIAWVTCPDTRRGIIARALIEATLTPTDDVPPGFRVWRGDGITGVLDVGDAGIWWDDLHVVDIIGTAHGSGGTLRISPDRTEWFPERIRRRALSAPIPDDLRDFLALIECDVRALPQPSPED